jgi:hypothetical protein
LHLHRLVDRARGTPLPLLQRLLFAGASVHERAPPNGVPLLHKVRRMLDPGGACPLAYQVFGSAQVLQQGEQPPVIGWM